MQLKFSVLALSLFVVVSGTSQVLANQNSNYKSCTSTSTSRASCTSTSSNQSIPSSSESSNSAVSQNEQANPAGQSLDSDDADGSSPFFGQSSPSNQKRDRPATSSQEQQNPSSRLDSPSMQGIESDSNPSGLENERSTPSSSKRTNEAESLPSGANDRSNSSNSNNSPSSDRASNSVSDIEQQVHEQINQYRNEKGLSPLTFDETISKEARMHSENMANGTVAFSHDGFGQRVKAISQKVSTRGSAENVAYNGGYGDPATKAVEGWLDSPGHRQNIEGNYNLTGIGVAQNDRGEYYFTQIFIRSNNES